VVKPTSALRMTWCDSKADSIVWIVEGKRQDRVVSVRIHAPKTILVFGIFLSGMFSVSDYIPSIDSPRNFIVARRFLLP